MAIRFNTSTVTTLVDRATTPAQRSALLAATARKGVAAAVAAGRASPNYRRFVDGVADRPEEAVRGDGSITYVFQYMGEIAVFALAYLQGRSPIGRGAGPRYRDSFIVAVDGRPIPMQQFKPVSVSNSAQVLIYSDLPYSRKVDVQRAGGRPIRYKVKADLFADAAAAVRQQFGNFVAASRVPSVEFAGRGTTRKDRKIDYPGLSLGLR